MRRHGSGPGAEADDFGAPFVLEGSAGGHAPRLVRSATEGPDFGEDRVAFLNDVHVRLRRDRLSCGREEGVEVEDEGADFGASVVGRDQLEGGDEVELGGGDVAEVEVLWGVRCGRGDGSADTLP